MNRYMRAAIYFPAGFLKVCVNKLFHGNHFRCHTLCGLSPLSEITVDRGGSLFAGKNFRMRDGAKLRIRKGAQCIIGNDVCLNSQNIITCRERIIIGNGVMLSPNVQIYDHDHDFRAQLGNYITTPIEIGDHCWIGANTVILRGTKLGSHCVVGAGSVLKGTYPAGSMIIQKRNTLISEVRENGRECS